MRPEPRRELDDNGGQGAHECERRHRGGARPAWQGGWGGCGEGAKEREFMRRLLGALEPLFGILAFSLRVIRSHEGDVSRVCDMIGFVL